MVVKCLCHIVKFYKCKCILLTISTNNNGVDRVQFPEYTDDCTESEEEVPKPRDSSKLRRKYNKKFRRIADKFKHKVKL